MWDELQGDAKKRRRRGEEVQEARQKAKKHRMPGQEEAHEARRRSRRRGEEAQEARRRSAGSEACQWRPRAIPSCSPCNTQSLLRGVSNLANCMYMYASVYLQDVYVCVSNRICMRQYICKMYMYASVIVQIVYSKVSVKLQTAYLYIYASGYLQDGYI